jgi:hypothetical protein
MVWRGRASMSVWISAGVVAFFLLVLVIRAERRMIRIASPELGLLNLMGPEAEEILRADRDAIRWAFYSVKESTLETPRCDVLLIYAAVSMDGSLEGTDSTLRQIIFDSGAKIVVVANENHPAHYTLSLKQAGNGHANIVLTIDRRGWIFASFLNRLFEIMAKGISMPVAWVRLAPQRPGKDHRDCPSTVFLCEAGSVVFKRQGNLL